MTMPECVGDPDIVMAKHNNSILKKYNCFNTTINLHFTNTMHIFCSLNFSEKIK
jgi:hypothetical protein